MQKQCRNSVLIRLHCLNIVGTLLNTLIEHDFNIHHKPCTNNVETMYFKNVEIMQKQCLIILHCWYIVYTSFVHYQVLYLYTISTFISNHVQTMYTQCRNNVSYKCTNNVKNENELSTLFAHQRYIVCTLFVHCQYIYRKRTLFVHCLYIVCTLFQHYLYMAILPVIYTSN